VKEKKEKASFKSLVTSIIMFVVSSPPPTTILQTNQNNIRMNMETVLALAFAMGRTLVLPPGTYRRFT